LTCCTAGSTTRSTQASTTRYTPASTMKSILASTRRRCSQSQYPGSIQARKPVSSKYPSKGQYRNHEDSYSEEYEVNNVKVDFDHQDNHKTYTVEAKAGDFIIGEVGRIDVNNGQTLEGVRYTALDGEVSQRRISQILERFFGTRSGS